MKCYGINAQLNILGRAIEDDAHTIGESPLSTSHVEEFTWNSPVTRVAGRIESLLQPIRGYPPSMKDSAKKNFNCSLFINQNHHFCARRKCIRMEMIAELIIRRIPFELA